MIRETDDEPPDVERDALLSNKTKSTYNGDAHEIMKSFIRLVVCLDVC